MAMAALVLYLLYRIHLYKKDELIFSFFFLSCQQHRGITLLIYAAKKGQVAIVDRLLSAGANIEFVDEVLDSLGRDRLWSSTVIRSYRAYLLT